MHVSWNVTGPHDTVWSTFRAKLVNPWPQKVLQKVVRPVHETSKCLKQGMITIDAVCSEHMLRHHYQLVNRPIWNPWLCGNLFKTAVWDFTSEMAQSTAIPGGFEVLWPQVSSDTSLWDLRPPRYLLNWIPAATSSEALHQQCGHLAAEMGFFHQSWQARFPTSSWQIHRCSSLQSVNMNRDVREVQFTWNFDHWLDPIVMPNKILCWT